MTLSEEKTVSVLSCDLSILVFTGGSKAMEEVHIETAFVFYWLA